MMRRPACAVLMLAFLQTGISNTGITITIDWASDTGVLTMTCDLSGNETLTQVNWYMLRDSNKTKLGTFHPLFGTYIPPALEDDVKMQGIASPCPSSSLTLNKVAGNESAKICCVFITFPSGKLVKCADTKTSITTLSISTISTIYKISNYNITEALPHMAESEQMTTLGRWTLIGISSTVGLILLASCSYMVWRNFWRGRQVFTVQQAYQTDIPAGTETLEVELPEAPQSQEPSQGFDPAKLYAKIKEDLYYGRLWRAYQGRVQTQAQTTPPGPSQVYSLLGEKPLMPQPTEKDGDTAPDTTTMTTATTTTTSTTTTTITTATSISDRSDSM